MTEMPEPDGPNSFGPYVLNRRIAVGGMAEVYAGRVERSDGFSKRVAIKRMHSEIGADPAFASMLADEARLCAALNHRNVVQTFDLEEVDGALVLVMEYIDGTDLGRWSQALWARGEQVPIDLAVYIAGQTCRGLDYAHRLTDDCGRPLGIVHRDVSPQNILLSEAGEVKIADFGIARTRDRVSDPGILKGKYLYMSPEQARMEPIDARSDVFSLGVVVWELLAGRPLHRPEPLSTLLEAVRHPVLALPSTLRPEVPARLDAVVARATALAPRTDSRTPPSLPMR